MRSEEVFFVTAARIDVAHQNEETGLFKMEVGVHVNKRIVANFHLVGLGLNGKLPQRRTIIGCVIGGKVSHVGSEVAL